MAYQFFTPQQPAPVNISLYGDAAQAGANLAKDIPNATTATLRGIQEGIQTGQQMIQGSQAIRANEQNAIIRQNQIEQLPTENAIRQEQLEAQQTSNDINALQLEVAQSTQALKLDSVKTELQTQAAQNNAKLKEIALTNKMYEKLQSPNIEDRLSVVNNPEFSPLLIGNPKLFESVADQLAPHMSPEQLKGVNAALNASKVRVLQAEREKQRVERLDAAAREVNTLQRKVIDDPDLAAFEFEIMNDPSNIRVLPYVEYARDGDGALLTDVNGNPEEIPGTAGYRVYVGEKELPTTIKKRDSAMRLNSYAGAYRAKKQLEDEALNYNEENDPAITPPQGQIPSVDGAQGSPTQQPPQQGGGTPEERLLQKQQATKERLKQKRIEKGLEAEDLQPSYIFDEQYNVTGGAQEAINQQRLREQQQQVAPPTTPAEVKAQEAVRKNVSLHPALEGYGPLIQSVALVESSGKPNAVSPKDARGLMQVLPSTFQEVVTKYRLQNADINDPYQNVFVGAIYLNEMIDTFVNKKGADLRVALAAYNGGPGRLGDALAAAKAAGDPSWEGVKRQLRASMNDRGYKEVTEYVDKVLNQYSKLV